jgi:tRNA threonylcarbamoyl adenosine modification protein YeaZ
MITLAFDTSTAVGSLALLRDDEPQIERTFGRDGLFPTLAALKLDLRTVDLIAVGVGPGSFTGIRVGIAAAKGLALPGGIPIKAVSSFDALAVTVAPQMPAECAQMCVLSDARRGEIYYALYDRTGRLMQECRIGTMAGIPGDAWRVWPEKEQCRWAAAVGRLARTSDLKLEPLYLRPTQYKKL